MRMPASGPPIATAPAFGKFKQRTVNRAAFIPSAQMKMTAKSPNRKGSRARIEAT